MGGSCLLFNITFSLGHVTFWHIVDSHRPPGSCPWLGAWSAHTPPNSIALIPYQGRRATVVTRWSQEILLSRRIEMPGPGVGWVSTLGHISFVPSEFTTKYNPKAEVLRISRQPLQSVKPQAWDGLLGAGPCARLHWSLAPVMGFRKLRCKEFSISKWMQFY